MLLILLPRADKICLLVKWVIETFPPEPLVHDSGNATQVHDSGNATLVHDSGNAGSWFWQSNKGSWFWKCNTGSWFWECWFMILETLVQISCITWTCTLLMNVLVIRIKWETSTDINSAFDLWTTHEEVNMKTHFYHNTFIKFHYTFIDFHQYTNKVKINI